MTIMRPPLTGDPQLDSWMDRVTQQIVSYGGVVSTTSTGTQGAQGDPGVSAVTLILYKRYDSNTLPVTEHINTTVTYTYATSTLDNESPDGWSREFPSLSLGNKVFAIQVNIADTADTEVIPAAAWSQPILISSVDDVIGVRIATNNGTALRGGTLSSTTMKAVVTRNGEDQTDIDHNGYHYKWTVPTGEVICVDSNRNVLNDGESPMLATGTEGNLVCTLGTPASNTEPTDIHGSNLREITLGTEDVNKTQLIELEVTNIP